MPDLSIAIEQCKWESKRNQKLRGRREEELKGSVGVFRPRFPKD